MAVVDTLGGALPEDRVSAVRTQLSATERLVNVAQELSLARDLDAIMAIVRKAARELTSADGATFILRDGDLCFYADENAIGPLWKGRRFPMDQCISGWVMTHRQPAVIEDIYSDSRVPIEAYRSTFVKSLAMVPIRTAAPIGAIGNYWARPHAATDSEARLLQALADLTSVALENVQLYKELQHRVDEAQQAIQVRDEFLSAAAHELRTPLTALDLQLASLKMMIDKAPSIDERAAPRAARALNSVHRLSQLIDKLLDVSRATLGELKLNTEPMDLTEVVQEVAQRFAEPAERAGSTLEVQASSPIPGRWDRIRIEHVVTHLLSNAVKFGKSKPISLTLGEHAGRVRIEVRDSGVGIAPEDVRRLFHRFERASPVRQYGGLGVGLYIVRRIVEAHGGSITVESQPGEGSRFIVDLPVEVPAASAA